MALRKDSRAPESINWPHLGTLKGVDNTVELLVWF
jgi:hypothetical protein